MIFKSGLFKFPFIEQLQDLVGHHFAVGKLMGLSIFPEVPGILC